MSDTIRPVVQGVIRRDDELLVEEHYDPVEECILVRSERIPILRAVHAAHEGIRVVWPPE